MGAEQEAMMQQQMMQQQQDEERSKLAYEQQQEERARTEQEELLRQQAEVQAPPAASNNSRPPSHQGNSRPPSHQGQQEYPDQGMGEPSNEMIPPQMRKALPARPTTARRAPPKLPTKEVKVNRGPTPVQQNPDEPPTSIAVGLITEQESDEEDDDADVAADMLSAPIPGFDDIDVDVDEDGMHGKLVGDILAEKKQMNAAAEETQEEAPEESQGIVIKKRRSSKMVKTVCNRCEKRFRSLLRPRIHSVSVLSTFKKILRTWRRSIGCGKLMHRRTETSWMLNLTTLKVRWFRCNKN